MSKQALFVGALLCILQNTVSTTITPTTTPDSLSDGALRLVRLNSCPHEGRLEYKHTGVWGSICNDMFNSRAAELACRQMGYGNGVFLTGVTYPGTGRIWLDNVECTASHTNFSQCSRSNIGYHDCTHAEDVVVACFNGTSRAYCPGSEVHLQVEGGLRLKDGKCSSEGRLEIFHSNVWGTICDDGFGEPEAYLACTQLGYDSGVTIKAPAPGTGTIWLDDLTCTYQHDSLAECGGSRWGREDCSHSEDVGVHCYNKSATVDCLGNPVPLDGGIRIVDGECGYTGRLEVWHAHRWGTICSVGFNDTDAAVACKQLGYQTGWIHDGPTGGERTHIWVKNIQCRGDEANLTACSHDSWGSIYGCSHEKDVGILCSRNDQKLDCAGELIHHTDGDLRLVDGNCSAYGLLEIFHNGRWGSVCDDAFTDVAATVACKELGFTDGFIRSPPRSGTGITWLDNVRCLKTHTRLMNCPHAPWGVEDCNHSEDIGIQCYNNTRGSRDCDGNPYPGEGTLRLIDGKCGWTGRLEIFHSGRWGSFCDQGFDDTEVQLACKQLNYKHGFLGTTGSINRTSGSIPHRIWLKDLNCDATHQSLHDCPHAEWGVTGCDINQDIYVTCSNTSEARDCDNNVVLFVEGQIRLVPAVGGNKSSGRLEIFHSGRWGTVCDDSFGKTDATVACRELGHHRGELGSRTLAPDGTGITWLDEVACLPTDTKIVNCRHHPWGREDCSKSEDVRLLCSDTTECSSNPCQNGGQCKDSFNAFNCQCLAGFLGDYCQIDVDECAGSPCENGASCRDGQNDYSCTCLAGYSGKNCSIDTDDCEPKSCNNHGKCVDHLNSYSCECKPGYKGEHCDTDIDECASYPCQNDGDCKNGVNQFTCDCKLGFDGKVCEKNLDDCAKKPCKNNGTCLDGTNWFFCQCQSGFIGKYCENELSSDGKVSIHSGGTGQAQTQVVSDGSAKGIAAVALCVALLVLIIVIVLIVRWKLLGGQTAPSDGREDEIAVWNGSSDKVNLVP